MGVIYKLKQDVVDYIISEKQGNPRFSCRELAEATSQKFGLHLSKSSVHDVLKESGVITPRGRKPQVKLLAPAAPTEQVQDIPALRSPPAEFKAILIPDVAVVPEIVPEAGAQAEISQTSPEYAQAGRIFLKAALWDLGVYSEENMNQTDWNYYLTYTKGIKVDLENNNSYFIDLPLPLERCIKEVADGLINNVKPFIVHKVSDEGLLKASMDAQTGFKINLISIVDGKDHVLLEFNDIMECKRTFLLNNRTFVESNEIDPIKRSDTLFFSQSLNKSLTLDNIMDLRGFDTINKDERVVTLLFDSTYENKAIIQEAAEKLNEMHLCDDQNRSVKVKTQVIE